MPTRVPSAGAPLDVISDPPGAEVILNGRPRGRTPLRLSGLSPGTYPIVVRKEGFLPREESVRIEDTNSSYTFRAVLAPAVTASSFVNVSSEPPGATVTLNGKAMGVTPVKIGPLEAGRYDLTIEYPEFPAQTRALDVKAGALHEVKARFGTF